MGKRSLARRTNSTMDEAQNYIDTYFSLYPNVKPFIENAVEYARQTHYTQTLFGDKISVFPGAESRQGINYRIQNSASITMIRGFYEAIKAALSYGIPIKALGNIHDSLQTTFPCKYYPHMKLINQKFFREKGLADIGVDYKYDFEICKSLADFSHFDPEFNMDTGEMKIVGPEDDVKYFIHHLREAYEITDYTETLIKPKTEDVLKDRFISQFADQGWVLKHIILGDDHNIKSIAPQNTSEFSFRIRYDFKNDPIIKDVLSIKFEVKDEKLKQIMSS